MDVAQPRRSIASYMTHSNYKITKIFRTDGHILAGN